MSLKRDEQELGDVNEKSRSGIGIDSVRTWFGKPNSAEKYYACAFLLSILMGIIFGLFDTALYRLLSGPFRSLPRNAAYIFVHNFAVDLLTVATGGILELLSNFLTFALISESLNVHRYNFLEDARVLLIVFGTYGFLEMAGHLCFGLVGFTYLERLILKRKTGLRRSRLFIVGVVLIFVAAMIEGWMVSLFRR